MKLIYWFWLCLKRQLKKPMIWIQLLTLPLTAALFLAAADREPGIMRVALAVEAEEKDDAARQAVRFLLCQEGTLDFYLCDTREQVLEDVRSRRAECGFVFLEDFSEGLSDGNLKKTVELVKSPSTVAGELASESVSGAVMSLVAPDALRALAAQDFFRQQAGENAGERMEQLYQEFLTDGSTFSFRYETVEGKTAEPERWQRQIFPARGLGAVYIWAAALFAAAAVRQDERRGIYGCMSGCRRYAAVYLSVLAPAFLAAVSCLVSVGLTGVWTNWRLELSAITVYCGGAALTAVLLHMLVRRETILCAVIPGLLFGSLVLCPVVIDLGRWFPAVSVLQKVFLPYYYLRPF